MANVGRLTAFLGLNTKEFERGMDKAGTKTETFGSVLKKIAGVAGVAFGTQQIIRFGIEASKLAGQLEGVSAAYIKLDRPDLLNRLTEATRGTVSELELMQKAVQADKFKIDLDVLAQGLEFAQKTAAQTGQDVNFLVDSFVTGVGRKSLPIIDNLGISLAEMQEEMKKTGDFTVALTNVMTRNLEAMGDVALTTSDMFAQLNADIQNMKADIGGIINREIGLLAQKWAGIKIILGDKDFMKAITDDLLSSNALITQLLGGVIEAKNEMKPDEDQFGVGISKQQADNTLLTLDQVIEKTKKIHELIRLDEIAAAAKRSAAANLPTDFDINTSGAFDNIDFSMIDALMDEEALDPEPYIEFTRKINEANEKMTEIVDNSVASMITALGTMAAQGDISARKIIKAFIAIAVAAAIKDAIVTLGPIGLALASSAGMAAAAIFDALVPEFSSGTTGGISSGGVSPIAQRGNQFNVGGNKVEVDGRKLSIVTERGAEFHEALT